MSVGNGTLAAILVMAAVTLATRWGGLLAMSLMPVGARVRRFIDAMSGSVLVALLAPMAVDGDGGARAALAITAAAMLLFKKPLPAIAAGILAAAAWRQL
jgi:uncharacterized membrane protein